MLHRGNLETNYILFCQYSNKQTIRLSRININIMRK